MRIAEARAVDGTPLPVTASIGVASFDGHPDFSHLVQAADQALYAAKRGGRNRSVIASQAPLQRAE